MQYKTGTTLRITNKSLQNEELSHGLFLRTKQKKIKMRNAFNNNISMDIKHSKLSCLSIQSGDVFEFC